MTTTTRFTHALFIAIALLLIPAAAHAETGGSHDGTFPQTFFFLVLMLLCARVGALVERIRQPAVLGELLMGTVLAAMAFIPGLGIIRDFTRNEFVRDVAEIGVILLLFRAGLESNIGEMKRVGMRATSVAIIGIVLPFVGGWFVGRLLLPQSDTNVHLFIGATLTATSVGITARVFKDLSFLRSTEAKIVLGAAVIDDVLGLLILAVVSGIASGGALGAGAIAMLSLKAFAFLVGSVVLGQMLAPRAGALLSRVHPGVGMKMAMALLFCGAFAYGAAALAGLAPIVGAFAAGLVLESVHFRDFHAPSLVERIRRWAARPEIADDLRADMRETADHEDHAHVESLLEGVSHFFVPIFFVYTGLQVNLAAFADPATVGIALAITVVAVVGKFAAGVGAGAGVGRTVIGVGMIPRGEVGLIFANIGKQLGVVDDRTFAIVLIVVVLTTLITPPLLSALIRRKRGRT